METDKFDIELGKEWRKEEGEFRYPEIGETVAETFCIPFTPGRWTQEVNEFLKRITDLVKKECSIDVRRVATERGRLYITADITLVGKTVVEVCRVCGRQFDKPKGSKHRYCEGCAREKRLESKREWIKQNRKLYQKLLR